MSEEIHKIEEISSLRKRADFLLLGKSGNKWVSQSLIIQARPNELGFTRVGFTVSKRVDKSAVQRNRIKRRLRAVVADVLRDYARPSCDYVLIGRRETALRPYDVLCKDLKWCLRKMDYAQKSRK